MKNRLIFVSCLAAGLLAFAKGESEPNAYAPVLDMRDTDGNNVDVYRGFIVRDEDTVSLVPELKATDKDEIGGARFICGYRIYSDEYDVPFEAQVVSHTDGRAKLKVKSGIKLADLLRDKYKFEITAFDCGSPTLHSEKAHVIVRVLPVPDMNTPPLPSEVKSLIDKQIEVIDVKSNHLNTESPTSQVLELGVTSYPKVPPMPDQGGEQFFDRPSYIVVVKEATLYDSIHRLRPAVGKSTSNICSYELLTPNVPFSVDATGNVKNTKVLDSAIQKSYIVSVVAKHCDGLVSKPTVINVQVSPICSKGWKDLPAEEEYKAGTKAVTPFSKAWFDSCETTCQSTENIAVTVSLESQGQINACKHDIYSMQRQRDTCGASPDSIELLPKGESWTSHLKTMEGQDAAFVFDGKTAVKVPSSRSNHTLGSFFTLSFWMQHGEQKKDGHKEHILCNSDGDSMNRHHYSLFVHNCRLVFLLRKEADEVASLDKFFPAEWRWSVPHVCDGNWHQYAVSVEYPTVRLYIDGQRMPDQKDVVDVVDDWALHPTKKVHFAQLTVGACWQGSHQLLGQYMVGSLAGVTMLTGTTETERVIKCMNSCGEKLQFHALSQLEVGMSVSFNSELTEITISGSNVDGVKKLLQQVGYTNTNGDPKPGYRTLHVISNFTCDGQNFPLSMQTVPVLVSAVVDPEITIAGIPSKIRTPQEMAEGADIFTEVMILSAPNKQLAGQENRVNKLDYEDVNQMQKDMKRKLMLDRCEVRVDQKMNSESEKLRLPSSLLVQYLLDTKEFDQGFDITGPETYEHYEEVLRDTSYVNTRVNQSFIPRRFTLKCSDMNGKFISNTYSIELGVEIVKSQAADLYSNAAGYAHIAASGESHMALDQNQPIHHSSAAAASSSSATIIAVVVVCIIFLLIVIVIAIVRIRTVQSGRNNNPNVAVEDGPEMEWDNSTLNITVNPLESDELVTKVKPKKSGSIIDSEDEMMPSDDEGEEVTNKDGGLEWDNSSY